MKKEYICPELKHFEVESSELLEQTQLDPTKDQQDITPTEEEYDGEFGANQTNIWDDEL